MSLFLAAAAAAKAVPAAAHGAAKAPPVITTLPTNAAAPAVMPQTWFQMHAGWLTHGIAGLFILSALGVIILMALQTTKQEGLSGTLGGRVESAYGRPGAEEQLKRITGFAATMFVICGTILALTGI